MSLHIFSKQTKIDFVGMRHYAYGLSALLILVGLITIFMNGGLRYGVDFAGGAAVQLQFEKPVADEDIKKSLAEMDCPSGYQQYGEDGRDYLVRFSTPNLTSEGIRSNILSSLEKSFAGNRPASSVWRWWGPRSARICGMRRLRPCISPSSLLYGQR